jgi:hypothetical protein
MVTLIVRLDNGDEEMGSARVDFDSFASIHPAIQKEELYSMLSGLCDAIRNKYDETNGVPQFINGG